LERQYLAYKLNLGNSPQQQPSSQEQDAILHLVVLRQMIEDEMLQQRAARFNLVASDEDVNAKVTEFKTPMTAEEFDSRLKQRNETLDDLKRDIRHSLTVNKLLNKEIESKITITDAAIKDYFQQHKAEYNLIEPQYNLAVIVVSNNPAQQAGNLQNNKASGEADAKKKIQILRNRLDSGDDFGNVAMNYSEDPNTGSNGGDLGFWPESRLKADPAVYNAISKLKPGQISETLPVYDRTNRAIGYQIFKLLGHEPAGQRELNDPRVQQSIRATLHDSRAQLLKAAYLDILHNEAKVRNFLAEQTLKQGVN
jgi:peptidyl-prolyl cis-trans isomerase SurA